jgi:hypothetical protein
MKAKVVEQIERKSNLLDDLHVKVGTTPATAGNGPQGMDVESMVTPRLYSPVKGEDEPAPKKARVGRVRPLQHTYATPAGAEEEGPSAEPKEPERLWPRTRVSNCWIAWCTSG